MRTARWRGQGTALPFLVLLTLMVSCHLSKAQRLRRLQQGSGLVQWAGAHGHGHGQGEGQVMQERRLLQDRAGDGAGGNSSPPDDGTLEFSPPEYLIADDFEPPTAIEFHSPPDGRTPRPPRRPPSPAPPPPTGLLPLRLVNGPSDSAGIVQVYDASTDGWGALCVPLRTFAPEDPQYADADVAKLVCRQLGLPSYGAKLAHPDSFTNGERELYTGMRGKALGTSPGDMCTNALYAGHVLACDHVAVWGQGTARSCGQLAVRLREAGVSGVAGSYVPAGVVCTDTTPPSPPPPSPSPPPPPSGSLPRFPGSFRIVDPATGSPLREDGTKVASGRLEVLMRGLGQVQAGEEPTWGTVCAAGDLPVELAKYACQSNGLPSGRVEVRGRHGLNPRLGSTPISLWFARGCVLRPDGMACQVLADREQLQQLLGDRAPDTPGGSAEWREAMAFALRACDPDTGAGHRWSAQVTCMELFDPDTMADAPPVDLVPPPPPPSPPLSPLPATSGVKINVTEYAWNVYGVQFGVAAADGSTVWGSFCSGGGMYLLAATAMGAPLLNTLCRQITGGVRPLYSLTALPAVHPSAALPSLPPRAVLLAAPVSLTNLHCAAAAEGLGSVAQCSSAVPADPLPSPPSPQCSFQSLSNYLLSCLPPRPSSSYGQSYLASMRLVGGRDGTVGRLEVLPRSALDIGWGTVCASNFGEAHAQAVCRDLGLPWTEAALVAPDSLPEADPEQPIHFDNVQCAGYDAAGGASTTTDAPLSFLRDCTRGWNGGFLPSCGHHADVVIACGGEGGNSPAPAPASDGPTPTTQPPRYSGYYGGYGAQPPPYGGPVLPPYYYRDAV